MALVLDFATIVQVRLINQHDDMSLVINRIMEIVKSVHLIPYFFTNWVNRLPRILPCQKGQ